MVVAIFDLESWSSFLQISLWLSVIGIAANCIVTRVLVARTTRILAGGEYVLITGCDTGIGNEAARLFDSLGFSVLAGCLLPDGAGAARLDAETSSNTRIVELDISDERSVQNCLELVSGVVGERGLWGLLNNAGILCYGHFEWFTWRQCQKQVDVNLLGTIRVTRAFLPLVQMRQGRIVTVTSINGLIAYPGLSVYCATKFALEGFCDSLRLEQRRHHVQVVSIQLGDFARLTGIFASHQRDKREMWDAMNEQQRARCSDFFQNFHREADEKCGLLSPPSFSQSPLRGVLVDVMTSSWPSARYLCMSQMQSFVFRVVLSLPATWRDWLLSRAFQLS